ncbi:Flp family type IVb pilin [candidate division CSSED10-310 bacterium]|uniref:Flp family type IVb pilin n=1 Tax=candidate division CSSED10-310 bacterium TaxID=2855610 RepID=A0ABV6YXK8_UNCC1
MERIKNFLKDEAGQTTVEWGVLSIMIAMGLVVIGLAFQNGIVSIIDALVAKIIDLINSISI